MRKLLLFLLFLNNVPFCFAQSINPIHVINLCDSQSIQGTTPQTNQYNTLRTSCSSQSLSSSITLYYVEIESGSTFTFTITPNSRVDFDFASWKNPDFSNLGRSDRGSQNTIQGGLVTEIGLSLNEPTETCETGGSSPPFTGNVHGKVRYYDVQAGDGILIAIDHWESSVIGYDLSFGGDAVLNCSIVSNNYTVCDSDNDNYNDFDLNTIGSDLNNSSNSFVIDFFENQTDANNPNATNILPSPYRVTTADSPKTIYARFRRVNGLFFVRSTPILLTVNPIVQLPIHAFKLEACDVNLIQTESFNLTEIESEINALNSNIIQYKYYENRTDAENDAPNFITNPLIYNSTSKTIYVQVSINGLCPTVFPLELFIEKAKIKTKTIEYSEFCATDTGHNLSYDLSRSLPFLLDNQNISDFEISYHHSSSDADSDINRITNFTNFEVPYNNFKNIYLRLKYNAECYIISVIELHAKERVKVQDQYNSFCEPFYLPELPNGYKYFTEPNAGGVNLPSNSIVYGKTKIYIYGNSLFIDQNTPEFNQCNYQTEFMIFNNDCTVPRGISPNGDGLNDNFDLVAFGIEKLEIFNRFGSLVYSHGKGYSNQWNGQDLNGHDLPNGTYFFSFESRNGPKNGWVHLTREVK